MYLTIKEVILQLFSLNESDWIPFLLIVAIITLILTRR